jgi:hypothetical protein
MEFIEVTLEEYKSFIKHIGIEYVSIPFTIGDRTDIVNKEDYRDIIATRIWGGEPNIYRIREDFIRMINEYQYKPNESNKRKAKFLKDEKWIDINPLELEKGMTFRMFEEDNTPVKNVNGDINFFATSDAYVSKSGIIGINMSFTNCKEEENEDN